MPAPRDDRKKPSKHSGERPMALVDKFLRTHTIVTFRASSLKHLVAFSLLMETGEGVTNKVPDYVVEKFSLIFESEHPEDHLDQENKAKLEQYLKDWLLPS